MQFRSGRCNNDLFCSLASGSHTISIPADGNFVCPQCSKPLVAAAYARRRSPVILGALAGGGLALAGSGLFAAGTFMGSGTAAQMPANQGESDAPAVPLQLAMTEVPSTAGSQAAADQAEIPANGAPHTQAEAPIVAVVVSLGERRLPGSPPAFVSGTRIAALDATVPPRHIVLPPPESTASHQSVPTTETRATAKSVAEQQRREQLAAVQASQAAVPLLADARDQAARLAAAQHAAQPPPPVKSAAPLAAAGISRPFAAVAVSGGTPDYPDDYDDSNRRGRVTVSCRIERDGSPHNCNVIETKGGAAFGKSVLKWLASGRVRYQPALHNGVPVAETQQWNVNFVP